MRRAETRAIREWYYSLTWVTVYFRAVPSVIAIPSYPPRVFPGPLMELKNRFEDLEAVLYSQIWPDRTVADGHHETVEP